MKVKIQASALAMCLTLAAPSAYSETTLRMKYETGKTIKQQVTMDQKTTMELPGRPTTTMNMQQIMNQEQLCGKVSTEGAELELKLTRMRATMQLPAPLNQTIKYDSDEKTTSNPLAAQLEKVLRPTIDAPWTLKSDMLGQISDIKLSPKFLDGVKGSPTASLMGDMFSEDGVKRMSEQSAIQLPEKAIDVGYEWDSEITMKSAIGVMKIVRHHTYQGKDSESGFDKIQIKLSKELEPGNDPKLQGSKVTMKKADGDGLFLFDSKKGRVVRSELKDHTEMEITAGAQIIPQVVDVNVVLEDVTGD